MHTPRPEFSREFLRLQEAVAGRYALVRELGRGGMGIVVLARDLSLERFVAIKLLPDAHATTPGARAQFLAEARTAAGLAHPHIVPIHHVEEHDGLSFYVMSYVEGETLGERVRRLGPLPADEVMRVVQEVAWALGHAHAHGVIHRDVKPDNVLLEAATGRVLVTDFGIARVLESVTTTPDGPIGTPLYVSPEVAQGGRGDGRSDLYSLGITAWVAATGHPPFTAASPGALLLAHLHTQPPALGTAAPRLPERFTRAVDRCLEKSPDARWSDAHAFAAEVDAARAHRIRVPAPVRGFLREWESVGGEVATAGIASAVAIAETAVLFVTARTVPGLDFDASILAWVFAVMAVLTAGLAKARIVQLIAHARTLLRSGVRHSRVIAALGVDDAQRQDERAVSAQMSAEQGRETLLVAGGSLLGAVGAFAMAFSDSSGWLNVLGAAGAVILPTISVRAVWRLIDARASEPLWSRLLRSRVGRWIFKAAGVGLPATTAQPALEGPEPTALAIGGAARELFAALPPDRRVGLEDVPTLLEALEREALLLRTARQTADVSARESTVVSALETLRLDLLRLHANAAGPSDLTGQLAQLRDLAREVEVQIAAERSVERLLAPEPTPH